MAIVQTALAAMGGVTAIGQVQDCIAQGQMEATPGGAGKTGTIVWEAAGKEFKIDFTSPTGNSSLVSGHGTPTLSIGSSVKKVHPRAVPLFVPILIGTVLLKYLQNPNSSIESGGNTTVGSLPATLIKINAAHPNSLSPAQFWYFDNSTGLPLRTEIRIPNANSVISEEMDFSDYRAVSGVQYPFQIATFHLGTQTAVIKVQSILINTNIAPSKFDPAGGAR
jgi:hypothetical protein